MKPQKKKKLDYLTRLSFKTIVRLKNWKTRYRNRKSTKAIGTIILILTFLVHLYLDGPFRSADQVRVDDKSIFLILHGLVTLILIASLLAGLINTFRALLWPLIMIRRLFSFFRLVLVGILPKEWRPNFEANVIRRVGIGFLTIVNALIFSIVRPSLEADTKLFFKALITNAQFTDYQISPYVLLFWIVLIGSLIFSFSHYGNEEGQRLTNLEKEEGKQTELLKEIKAAILNVPNEDILHGYHETFYDLRSASNRLDRLIKDNDFKSFESGLNEALKILFEFSKKFLAKGKKVRTPIRGADFFN